MLRHMAVYTWAEGTSDADIAEFTGMLERLPARIPEIRGYAFGPDLGLVPGNGDFGLVAELDDEAAFRTYVAHPDHQPVLAWVAAHVAHRSAVQLSI